MLLLSVLHAENVATDHPVGGKNLAHLGVSGLESKVGLDLKKGYNLPFGMKASLTRNPPIVN